MLGRKAVMAHAGNTRLYLYRNDEVHQLSKDHTMAAEFVRSGIIEEEAAHDHIFRHTVTRSLGQEQSLIVDTLLLDLLPGDRLLLCSNGLVSHVRDDGALTPFFEHEIEKVADLLIENASSRDGHDDMTAVVVKPLRALFQDVKSRVSLISVDRYFELLGSVAC